MIELRLEAAQVGARLDRAVHDALVAAGHEVSRAQVALAFDDGGVTSEGDVLKRGHKLDRPRAVDVVLPPSPLERIEGEAIPLELLHEDEDLLVVVKPAGMVVHPSAGHRSGTLVHALLHHLRCGPDALPTLPGNDATRPGIVHRLDKDTSGVMLLAKTAGAQSGLAEQFQDHSIGRRYWALVTGVPHWEAQRVETLHGRDPSDRRRFSPTDGTRRAISHLRCVARGAHCAALRCELDTGRTHQIRMHARHVGHPIVGDELYAGGRAERALRKDLGLTRQALHAEFLRFVHPRSRETLEFSADLPPDLAAAAGRAGLGEENP